MAADLSSRAETIRGLVGRVEERSPVTLAEYRTRLENKLREVLASTTIDESRILTEAAIFADRIAVDEETVAAIWPSSTACLQAAGPSAASSTSCCRR